jgi:shikimate kinase
MGPDRVCLCGYMGAGKTEVGKRLANLLGHAFVDLDAAVSVSENQKISELFFERGESYFRACELREARKLLDRRQMVLALGGGALTTAELLSLVRARAYLVYLQASPEILSDRIRKGDRPLLAEVESLDDFRRVHEALMKDRQSGYEQADLTVATDSLTAAQVTEQIFQALNKGVTCA